MIVLPCSNYQINDLAISRYGSELAGDCLNCMNCGQSYEAHAPIIEEGAHLVCGPSCTHKGEHPPWPCATKPEQDGEKRYAYEGHGPMLQCDLPEGHERAEIASLTARVEELEKQRDELQQANTREVLRRREAEAENERLMKANNSVAVCPNHTAAITVMSGLRNGCWVCEADASPGTEHDAECGQLLDLIDAVLGDGGEMYRQRGLEVAFPAAMRIAESLAPLRAQFAGRGPFRVEQVVRLIDYRFAVVDEYGQHILLVNDRECDNGREHAEALCAALNAQPVEETTKR